MKDLIEIAGCYALTDKETTAFQNAFGGKVFASYEAALDDPKVDAVLLATPHSTHWQQIIAAAKAKKNVFVEKPLALTVETGARSKASRMRMSLSASVITAVIRKWRGR